MHGCRQMRNDRGGRGRFGMGGVLSEDSGEVPLVQFKSG